MNVDTGQFNAICNQVGDLEGSVDALTHRQAVLDSGIRRGLDNLSDRVEELLGDWPRPRPRLTVVAGDGRGGGRHRKPKLEVVK